jgi:hypothetical protein
MTLLTGLTEAGVEVPVQVKPDGRLVAEGLMGPSGPVGPVGPVGPAGPVGSADWTRTGTELSPKTAGDSVFTSGAVKVGGTTAAPNITLKANGEGAFANNITINTTAVDGLVSVTGATNSGLLAKGYFLGERTDAVGGPAGRKRFNLLNGINPVVSVDPTTNRFNVSYLTIDGSFGSSAPTAAIAADGSAFFSSDVKIGGTLPASPNITLSADGTGVFHKLKMRSPDGSWWDVGVSDAGTLTVTRAALLKV